jgi:hypothetical protein
LKIYHIVRRSYNAQSNAFSRKSEKESVIRGENVRFKISINFSPAVIAKKFTTLEERQCLFPLFFQPDTSNWRDAACGQTACTPASTALYASPHSPVSKTTPE